MLNFWRAIFYSDLLAPVFKAVATALGVTPQVCKDCLLYTSPSPRD